MKVNSKNAFGETVTSVSGGNGNEGHGLCLSSLLRYCMNMSLLAVSNPTDVWFFSFFFLRRHKNAKIPM